MYITSVGLQRGFPSLLNKLSYYYTHLGTQTSHLLRLHPPLQACGTRHVWAPDLVIAACKTRLSLFGWGHRACHRAERAAKISPEKWGLQAGGSRFIMLGFLHYMLSYSPLFSSIRSSSSRGFHTSCDIASSALQNALLVLPPPIFSPLMAQISEHMHAIICSSFSLAPSPSLSFFPFWLISP